jgi:hypothetical protein
MSDSDGGGSSLPGHQYNLRHNIKRFMAFSVRDGRGGLGTLVYEIRDFMRL